MRKLNEFFVGRAPNPLDKPELSFPWAVFDRQGTQVFVFKTRQEAREFCLRENSRKIA